MRRLNQKMTNLRVNLGWGAWPGGTGIIPPLWKVCQREGNLVRCTRFSSMPSRGSVGEDGSVVSGVDNKVVVSHSVLSFVLHVGEEDELRGE